MATAVLDLEFTQLPQEITGLDAYQQALILIRLKGRPVGQALIPVIAGRAGDSNLLEALLGAADSGFWEQWLRDYLQLNEHPDPGIPFLQATVAICTRDRPDDLRRCLDALMRLPDDGQELLVIDNCPSTDATDHLVRSYQRVRYVRAPKPGLDVARNRALREASHNIIAFTDDDAAPDQNWLRALLRNFTSPRVLCVTGLTMPLELETASQEQFQRLGGFGRGFKRMVYDGAHHNPLEGWEAGAGVNMALRRDALESIGFFDELLDVGTRVGGGGDTDMFRRILASGYCIVYDPEAWNGQKHRRQWHDLRRQLYGYESAAFAIWTKNFLFEGEFQALKQAWDWFWRELLVLRRAFWHRPGSTPIDLVLARFRGAVWGPWTYLYSRWIIPTTKPGT